MRSKVIVAALCAPAAAAVAFYLTWLVSIVLLESPASWLDTVMALPATWPIIVHAFVGALVLEILFGLPLLALFRHMGWLSSRAFLAGGCLVALAFYALRHGPGPLLDLAVSLAEALVAGGVGALVFGYVGGWLTSRLSSPA